MFTTKLEKIKIIFYVVNTVYNSLVSARKAMNVLCHILTAILVFLVKILVYLRVHFFINISFYYFNL